MYGIFVIVPKLLILQDLQLKNFLIKYTIMAGRTDWLTKFAKPVADDLAARCGSLKKVLSAGILALKALSAEEREKFMAAANGMELKSLKEAKKTKPDLQEAIDNVKYFVKFKLPSPEDQKALDELRRALGSEIAKQKKKAKRG